MADIHNRFRRIGNWMTDGNQGGELGRWMKNLWRKFRGTGVLKGLVIVALSTMVTLLIRYSSGETKIWYEIILNDADAISLTTVGIIFILESSERKKRSHYEAWQVIDNAASGKIEVSFARKKALEDLYKDGVSLAGINLKQADLKGMNFKGANLEDADFSGANLEGADLEGAKLEGAKFYGSIERPYSSNPAMGTPSTKPILAILKQVNFDKAELKKVSFKNLDLSHSSLVKADLRDADLTNTNFSHADLTEAKLEGACLDNANLRDTIFSVHQLAKARLCSTKLPEKLAHLSNRDCEPATEQALEEDRIK